MNKNLQGRRGFVVKFTLFSASLLTSGCVPNAMNAVLHKRDKDISTAGAPEDFYQSQLLVDNSAIYPVSASSHYNPERSAKAKEIFKSIAYDRVIPKALPIPTELQTDTAVAMFRKVREKYADKMELDLDDAYDIIQNMIPMLRMYVDLNSINPHSSTTSDKSRNGPRPSVAIAADGTISIPPGFTVTVKQKGYCLDAGLPAPGKNEKLILVPSADLISEPLRPLYRAMQRKAYADPTYRNHMQKLMWTLRSAGQQNGLAAHVTPESLQQMESAMPGGAKLFVDYHNQQGQKKGFLEDLARRFDPQKRQKAFQELYDKNLSAMSSPVMGEIPYENPHYQMLSPSVASFTAGAGTLVPEVILANTGNKPFNFNPIDWVAKPVRKAQQIAMYPPTPGNITFNEYPFASNESQVALWERMKAKLDAALLGEAARFLNEKILKDISKTALFRKYAFRLLTDSPATKRIIEAMPYIGNMISAYEAVSGKNWVTGRDLNAFERIAARIGTIPGGNFLKSALKERIAKGAQMAFAGAGFATNSGLMEEEIASYAKTYTNPIQFVSTYSSEKIRGNMNEAFVELSRASSLTTDQRKTFEMAFKEGAY